MSADGYLTLAQARQALGVSAFVFNKKVRPYLNEIKRGPRTILFLRPDFERGIKEAGFVTPEQAAKERAKDITTIELFRQSSAFQRQSGVLESYGGDNVVPIDKRRIPDE